MFEFCVILLTNRKNSKEGILTEAYFAFTDECGNYEKERAESFNKSHPFYVRSTVIISLTDYLLLQQGIDEIKGSFGLAPSIEIKWAHYGSALKGNYRSIPHSLTPEQLRDYYERAINLLCMLKSAEVYYTLTDNSSIGRIEKSNLIRMHLQNAYQRVQTTVSSREGFAIVVADDLNNQTKALKEAVYGLTLAGDFVDYTNIKKGLYIDFSNQCQGLQIADICAGVFTASLKYESAPEGEKHKFQCGHDLLFKSAFKKVRSSFFNPPYYEVYKYGVKEVPNFAGDLIAKSISRQLEKALEDDLMR